MSALKSHQQVARLLGYAGIAPFALAVAALPHPLAFEVMRVYGLVIVAFVCGNAWTTALMNRHAQSPSRSAVLVVSNLLVLAVAACALLPPGIAPLAVNAFAFSILLMMDYRGQVFAPQPRYYRTMRTYVTAAVVGLHLIGMARI